MWQLASLEPPQLQRNQNHWQDADELAKPSILRRNARVDKCSSSEQDRKDIVDERPGEIKDYSTECRLRKIDQDKNPR
jgi:hypothetical protein